MCICIYQILESTVCKKTTIHEITKSDKQQTMVQNYKKTIYKNS